METIYNMCKSVNRNTGKERKNTIMLNKLNVEKVQYDSGEFGYKIILPGREGGIVPADEVDNVKPSPGRREVVWAHTMEELIQYAHEHWGL